MTSGFSYRFCLSMNPNRTENLTLLPWSISRLSSLFSSSFHPSDSTGYTFPVYNTYIIRRDTFISAHSRIKREKLGELSKNWLQFPF